MADYYPTNMEGKAYWHAKFSQNIAGLAAKYNITVSQLTALNSKGRETFAAFFIVASYREYNSKRPAALKSM